MPDSAILIFCPIVRYAWTSFWSLFTSVRADFLVPLHSQSLFSAYFRIEATDSWPGSCLGVDQIISNIPSILGISRVSEHVTTFPPEQRSS